MKRPAPLASCDFVSALEKLSVASYSMPCNNILVCKASGGLEVVIWEVVTYTGMTLPEWTDLKCLAGLAPLPRQHDLAEETGCNAAEASARDLWLSAS
jgi:hypothetical protein